MSDTKRIVYVLKNECQSPTYDTGLTSIFTTGATRTTPAVVATPRLAARGTWTSW